MPGLPLSDVELSTVLRETLSRIAKRYYPGDDTTEDADFAIVQRLVSLFPEGPRRDIIDEELIRVTLHSNEASTDETDSEARDER